MDSQSETHSDCTTSACQLNQENSESTVKTTCCSCPHCTCRDKCTCAKGDINCDPCVIFVQANKKD